MEISNVIIEEIKDTIPIMVGKNIRSIREKKGLSQTDLANLILSDRQYLYKIETAKVGITITKLAVIAMALEVSMAELVESR